MAFTLSKRKLNGMNIHLMNDTKLMVVQSHKYLGVLLDPHLKYDLHIREQFKIFIIANL